MSNRLFEQVRECAHEFPKDTGVPQLAAGIEAADRRYVLEPEVSAAAWQVVRTSPQSVLRAWDFVRSPAPLVWLEWPDRLRREICGQIEGWKHEISPIQFLPDRGGVLVTTDHSGRRGTARWIWNVERSSALLSEDLPCQASLASVRFDLDDPGFGTNGVTMTGSVGGWEQVRSHFRLEIADKWTAARLVEMAPNPQAAREAMRNYIQHAANDLAGEIEHLCAVLLLLVARNAIKEKEIDELALRRLNAARRRRGRNALLPHREVTMALSRVQRRRMEAGGSRGPSRLHLVSGHFKTRKTGVFWWRPHLRGDATLGEMRQRTVRVSA